jgi:hypothetical protein
VFSDLEYIAEGTHSCVYKAVATDTITASQSTRCLKIFRKDWITPFNLETTAYAYLVHAGIKEDFIPEIHGWGLRTVSGWGLEAVAGDASDDSQYYGIMLEWIEGAEPLSEKNVTLGSVMGLINGLAQIHNAGILHFDTFERNMLVVPETDRGVWIDFSCAQIGEEYHHASEMLGAGGTAVEYVKSSMCTKLLISSSQDG